MELEQLRKLYNAITFDKTYKEHIKQYAPELILIESYEKILKIAIKSKEIVEKWYVLDEIPEADIKELDQIISNAELELFNE